MGVGLLCNLMKGVTQEIKMLSHNSAYVCWLCGKPVDVGVCNTDEHGKHGKPVHETCYITRLAFEDGTRGDPRRPPVTKQARQSVYHLHCLIQVEKDPAKFARLVEVLNELLRDGGHRVS